MKAAQLRQSILQAAVQGKLVPQNVHDEPASELLERIRQEKARLVKEGKIKKEKPLPSITEDEIPYDLPDGWVWCRLGEIVLSVKDGPHFSPPYEESGIPFVSARNISPGGIDFTTAKYISTDLHNELSKRCIPEKGDILYTKGGVTGVATVNNYDINFNVWVHVAVLKMASHIDAYFLRNALNSPHCYELSQQYTHGTGNRDLGLTRMILITIPLPPLAEQQRIVTKANELMVLCDELEAAEKELDSLENRFAEYLPKSILQAAVQGKLVSQNIHDELASELLERIRQEKARLVKDGKLKKEKPIPPITEDEIPYDLPDGWVWCRLADVGEVVGGATPLSTEPSYYAESGTGIPWITPADMKYAKNNMIAKGSKDITPVGYDSCSTKMLPAGSIVFSSRAPIGLMAFAQNELCTNQGFKSVIPYNMAMNKWVFYALKHMTESIIGRASGTTFLEVSGEFMRKELFPLPPLAEQQRIVAKVDELMALCDELKAAKDISVKRVASNIVPFPQQGEDEREIGIAARGEMQEISAEAAHDIREMFGDDSNA